MFRDSQRSGEGTGQGEGWGLVSPSWWGLKVRLQMEVTEESG